MHPYTHIDPEVLLKATGGDTETFCDLSRTFLRIAPPMLEAVREAVASCNLAAAERAGHALKSTAALAGAQTLAGMAELVEALARESKLHDIGTLLHLLAEEFMHVMREVRTSIELLGKRCSQASA